MTEAYRPGLENVIACETEISFLDVDHEEIVLRGYDLIDLAKKVSYIDIIGLLIDKRLPNEAERQEIEHTLKSHRQVPLNIWAILKQLPPTTHPMDMLRTGVSALSGFDPNLDDQSLRRTASGRCGSWPRFRKSWRRAITSLMAGIRFRRRTISPSSQTACT